MSDGQSPSGSPVASEGQDAGPFALLMQLLREGRSFSGYERHHCFLNTADGRFSDISAVSGVDLPEDGRGVARCDWDLDGDLDLWISNRSGPQLRFLLNESATQDNFIALRLEGRDCNRDAIGARVELLPDTPSDAEPRSVQTLRAGDGFLAQSSKWLHFGLGNRRGSQQAVVRWPGGGEETFSALQPGRRYKLVQGSGQASIWQPPNRDLQLQPGTPVESPGADVGELVAVSPLSIPRLDYRDWERMPKRLQVGQERIAVVNLWASWCAPCMVELAEWTARAADLRAAGIDVIALAVDGLDPEHPESTPETAQRAIERLGFPFNSGAATRSVVAKLQTVNDLLFDTHQPLPVPVSFVIDADRRVTAIARGPLEVSALLEHVGKLAAAENRAALPEAALQFPGRWASVPIVGRLEMRLANVLLDRGGVEDAAEYTRKNESLLSTHPAFAELLNRIGANLGGRGQYPAAINWLRQSIDLRPTALAYANLGWAQLGANDQAAADAAFASAIELDPQAALAHAGQGVALEQKGQAAAAQQAYERALQLDPQLEQAYKSLIVLHMRAHRSDDAMSTLKRALDAGVETRGFHHRYGLQLQARGRIPEAVEHFRAEIATHERQADALMSLAWLLACHPDDGIRNGSEAVEIARLAYQHGGPGNPNSLRALAAAYAEVGDFNQAIIEAESALEIAQSKDSQVLVQEIEQELQDYRKGRPNRMR